MFTAVRFVFVHYSASTADWDGVVCPTLSCLTCWGRVVPAPHLFVSASFFLRGSPHTLLSEPSSFFCLALDTGPRRPLSLALSDKMRPLSLKLSYTKVYEQNQEPSACRRCWALHLTAVH